MNEEGDVQKLEILSDDAKNRDTEALPKALKNEKIQERDENENSQNLVKDNTKNKDTLDLTVFFFDSKDTIQTTLYGSTITDIPKVRTSDGHLVEWNRKFVIRQLLKETRLSEQLHGNGSISEEEARDVAIEVEKRVKELKLKFLSGPLIRELVNLILLEKGHNEWRNISTRVGTPVFDAYEIDIGDGFEAKDNANLQDNAETSHKKKADKMSKEQYLLMLPPKLSDVHLNGDIHIHDLEYFGTRAFCQDWDLRYFFYYGLMPDGAGTKASVAGPAKRAEVAILHAVKALGSAQTNFAGGQGFYNFLTFLAPYFENLKYEEIEQLMQMFVYEMTQMMVARGGQVVFSSVQLSPGVPKIWRDKPAVFKGKIWDGRQAPLRTYGAFEKEVRLGFEALMNIMLKGDYWGKPFNFPKPEISIEPDFMTEDDEFNKKNPDILSYDALYTKAFELAAKYGAPYFDNQLPEYRGGGKKAISCYQCLPKDEIILVENEGKIGVKEIKDLQKGEKVLSFTPNPSNRAKVQNIQFSTPLDIFVKHFDGEVYTIQLEGGKRIRVTEDHPLTINNNDKIISAKYLIKGDSLPVITNIPKHPYPEKEKNTEVVYKKVEKIITEEYSGLVYDPVEVKGNNFANWHGVFVRNCCAYNFSSSNEKDKEFEDKLYFRDGKHFSMGAWQVVSLNCPRASYKAKGDNERLFEELRKLMDQCVEVFKIKRKWMNVIITNNRAPFMTQRPRDPVTKKRGDIAVNLRGLVYTIGVVGINEMVQHHTGKQIHESEDSRRLALRAMNEMKFYAKTLSKDNDMEIALARTPAETTAQRFAVSDLLHKEYRTFAEKLIKGNLKEALEKINETRDLPIYYTNGTHIPVDADISLYRRIHIEEAFFPIVDGGNIMHIWLGEASPDPQGLKEIAMNIAKNTRIGYFAFTKDMTVCMDDFSIDKDMADLKGDVRWKRID